MECKGIVRRVDELGRIVLPREMRKSLNIREGTKLEIGIVDGSKFLLSKYSDMVSLKEYSDAIANAISVSIEHDVLISDMEKILSANKKKYINKLIKIKTIKITKNWKNSFTKLKIFLTDKKEPTSHYGLWV